MTKFCVSSHQLTIEKDRHLNLLKEKSTKKMKSTSYSEKTFSALRDALHTSVETKSNKELCTT